jgi:hypothetical protein
VVFQQRDAALPAHMQGGGGLKFIKVRRPVAPRASIDAVA